MQIGVDFSRITPYLYIGKTPGSRDYDMLRSLGVRLVINMRFEHRAYRDLHQPPMPVLWLPTIDSPLFPIPVSLLQIGVRRALSVIEAGGVVYVHCAQGIHRGVAMGAAILIARGYSPQAAMRQIKEGRPVARPETWYIRRQILRFAHAWEKSQSAG